MKVPMLDLREQYKVIQDEFEPRLLDLVASGGYVLGPHVRSLEEILAALCGASHGIGVASGTDALLIALRAVGVEPGDEVITTPYSFFATASAIIRIGARPVFADIRPDTYNLDPVAVADRITSRTRAILPVHLYGQPAEMDALLSLAAEYGLVVVEDAAQAVGARYRGKPIAGLGDAGCFSFYPTKNLSGMGDGGLIVTQGDAVAENCRALRVHGALRTYMHEKVGYNSRLDEIQAAAVKAKLPYLPQWNAARISHADYYNQRLSGLPLQTPAILPECETVYHQYVIRVPDRRDALMQHLRDHDVACAVYYPLPLHLQPCFADLGYTKGDMPVSELASEETLALPIYAELKPEQLAYVTDTIRSFFSR